MHAATRRSPGATIGAASCRSMGAMRVHLDTDLGGDPDDACALAMLLGWPGVELVGITTTIDPGGRRAGCVAHCLRLTGREDVLVAAGAAVSMTTLQLAEPAGQPYWPATAVPRPSPPGAALDLLDSSIAAGRPSSVSGPTPTSGCWRSPGRAAWAGHPSP